MSGVKLFSSPLKGGRSGGGSSFPLRKYLTPTLTLPLSGGGEIRHAQAIFVLAIISLLLFLPGFFSLPPTDRDESRFAQATKQMVQSGDYINIRFQNEARNKKPIGIYWLQAAAVKLSGYGENAPIWVYRLPSLLGAIAAVALTYWALLPLMRREEAFYAALLFSACILLGVEARLAKTDAVLLATVTASMGALLRVFIFREKIKRHIAPLFWISFACGVLIKGPLILLVDGGAAAALCLHRKSYDWLKHLRPVYGLIVLTLIVAPWLIAIIYETGGTFLRESLGQDMFAKVASAQEMHGAPPGTYLVLVWFTFFPGACLFAANIPYIFCNWRQQNFILLFLWILPAWLVFELIPTKLPHYVLPLYPALAGIIILALAGQDWRMTTRWQRFCMSALFVVPPLLLFAAFIQLLREEEGRAEWLFLLLVPLAAWLGWLAFMASKTNARRAIALTVTGTFVIYAGIFERVASRSIMFMLSPDLASVIHENTPCNNPYLASAGYHEPSLIFLTNKDIFLTDGKGAADFLMQKGCRIALVEENFEFKAFTQRLRKEGMEARHLALVVGRNMNGGQLRRIGLWVLKP